jgi:Zn-finger protein
MQFGRFINLHNLIGKNVREIWTDSECIFIHQNNIHEFILKFSQKTGTDIDKYYKLDRDYIERDKKIN